MKRPRLTKRVIAGLKQIEGLAYADVECSEPGDFSRAEREQLRRGFEYIAYLTRTRHRPIEVSARRSRKDS